MKEKSIHLLLPVNILVRNGFVWCLELLEEERLYHESTRSSSNTTCATCLSNYQKATEDPLHPLRDYVLLANLQRSLVMRVPKIVGQILPQHGTGGANCFKVLGSDLQATVYQRQSFGTGNPDRHSDAPKRNISLCAFTKCLRLHPGTESTFWRIRPL